MPVLETKGALSAQGYGLTTSQPQRVFIEDVFSTWLYTGNNGSQTIANGIQFIENEVFFISAGTTSWVVPSGVTSISVVCIGGGGGGAGGGGGGGGGGLSYVNNLAVTPGETLTVVTGAAGSGGGSGSSGIDGGASSLARGATTLVRATGGFRGIFNGSGGAGGTATTGTGFTGGAGGTGTSSAGGGGGGAAGYAGVGGAGGSSFSAGSAGSGGGGGGGGGTGGTNSGGIGGGVGFLGQGANGAAGTYPGGAGGRGGVGSVISSLYGGGGVSASTSASGGGSNGGSGAVRIIWSGSTRQFPTTQTSTVVKNNGLVWIKARSSANLWNTLTDTVRGPGLGIYSNNTQPQNSPTGVFGFTMNGFNLLADGNTNSSFNYASWTFCEQPRFFDIVTWTGNGVNRTIAHNLDSVPGCIMVKRLDTFADWQVYHRNLANTQYMVLNSTAAAATGATRWNSTTPTSTVFSLGTDATVNASGGTYVAYLFAHDAGGFGATGADNVISCGSYTGNGSATGPVVTLGYEPQWLLIKRATGGTADWNQIDNMRGFVVGGTDVVLNPNQGAVGEISGTFVSPTATGFQLNTTDAGFNASGGTYIYIAIRRGPMRTPTSGFDVYTTVTGNTVNGSTVSFVGTGDRPVNLDALWVKQGRATTNNIFWTDRLRGASTGTGSLSLVPSSVAAETTSPTMAYFTGIQSNVTVIFEQTITLAAMWGFKRAPGFFDVVCYTGDGVIDRDLPHNLGVKPEFAIVKSRNTNGTSWYTEHKNFLFANMWLNSSAGINPNSAYTVNLFSSTATTLRLANTAGSTPNTTNTTGNTYVAYLFASVPGVSRVGSYTGTGATQTIDCGFSGGARFVLIKRVYGTGDWYVWDSARGIVAGNDPYLMLNSTAAEVTNTDWVDTASSGFELSNAAGNLANTNGGSYIFLSIA